MIRLFVIFALLLLILSLSVSCARESNQPSDIYEGIDRSAWLNFNKIILKLGSADKSYAVFAFNIFDNSDFKIDIKSDQADGAIMMIGGRLMLIKGLDLKPGYEINTLDSAMIMMRTALMLLYLSFPDGPPIQPNTYPIKIDNNETTFRSTTPNVYKVWVAPWSLEGELRVTDSKHLSFDLSAKFKDGDSFKASGEWTADIKQPSYPDNTSLDGWKVITIGVSITQYDKSGKLIERKGPPSPPESCKTIGDLRNFLKK